MARIAVIGHSGQLARALNERRWAEGVEIICGGREIFDLERPDALATRLSQCGADLIINAAAYTAVDKAESESEKAWRLNRDGPAALAAIAKERGAALIHVSTDYVFDGTKEGAYLESDPIRPAGVYGLSKAEGETAIRKAHADHVILRTSWVFSATGQNFVKTMLRLGAVRREIGVVDDQRGRPTYAGDLADWIAAIAQCVLKGRGKFGTFHAANDAPVSWHGFAAAIFERGARRGFSAPEILKPITTADYPTPARRPANSVLATGKLTALYGIEPRGWRAALDDCLDGLKRQGDF